MDFYKGYIETIGKHPKPGEQIKGRTSFPSLQDVKDCPEYAGILAERIVVVDIDDSDQANTAIEIVEALQIPCRAIKTSRGVHIIFTLPDKDRIQLKNWSKCSAACGLSVDYKCGSASSYEVLKYEGKEREIIIDSGISELPIYFYPMPEKKLPNLWHMKDGDGRNDTLFKYIINCVHIGLDMHQTRSLLKVINQYVFQDHLDDQELDTITRDEAFQDILVKGKKTTTSFLSELMISRDYVIRMDKRVFIYQPGKGKYSEDVDDLKRKMDTYMPSLTKSMREEVLENLRLHAPERQFSNVNYLLFKNGVYDLDKKCLVESSPQYIIPNQIPWDYDPYAYSEQMENVIYDWCCGDEKVFDLLEELIGYSMYRGTPFRTFFIIVGDKRNGKTKFLDMLEAVIGEENTSRLLLHDIGKNFRTQTIKGKLLNIGDDIEDDFIKHVSLLKNISSGTKIDVDKKNKDSVAFKPYTTLVFSANIIPFINDGTGAVMDRMVIIPFNAHFEEGSDDPFLEDALNNREVMEYLVRIGIEGLRRVLENKRFTIPQSVQNAMKRYSMEKDPIAAFLNDRKDELHHMSTKKAYTLYEKFCEDNDISSRNVSPVTFTRRINNSGEFKSYHDPKRGENIFART